VKDYRIIDLKDFLEIADTIETPFKFYEFMDGNIKGTIWMRTSVITYEGKSEKISEELLQEHNFKQIKELDTRRIMLEDLI